MILSSENGSSLHSVTAVHIIHHGLSRFSSSSSSPSPYPRFRSISSSNTVAQKYIANIRQTFTCKLSPFEIYYSCVCSNNVIVESKLHDWQINDIVTRHFTMSESVIKLGFETCLSAMTFKQRTIVRCLLCVVYFIQSTTV